MKFSLILAPIFYSVLSLALLLTPFLTPRFALADTPKIDEITIASGNAYSNINASILVHVPPSAVGSGESLPVIFIMSGFQTADGLITKIADPIGHNLLVVFRYPLDEKTNWLDWTDPADTQALQQLPTVALQAASALNWLNGPDLVAKYGITADMDRINTMAISLGSLFLPAAIDLAQLHGQHMSSAVFAFCGARLDIAAANQVEQSPEAFLASFLAPGLKTLVAPFEPLNFLPQVSTTFLILNASNDQVFPKESREALVNATPADKRTVVEIAGQHIGLQQDDRIAISFDLIKQWLVDRHLVNN